MVRVNVEIIIKEQSTEWNKENCITHKKKNTVKWYFYQWDLG